MRPVWLLSIMLGLFQAQGALAQDASNCATQSSISAPWQSWATNGATVIDGALGINHPYDVSLSPMAEVKLYLKPEAIDTSAFGGVFHFTVPHDGVYAMAVSDKAWISVVGDSGAIGSSGHGHGPDCSGIRKYVEFPLKAGSYDLQIENAIVSQIKIMIIAKS